MGYQESGEFDDNGKFGEIGHLMKFRQKDLDLRLRVKEGGIRKVMNFTKMSDKQHSSHPDWGLEHGNGASNPTL